MICPKCGYALSAFDKECPRCHGNGVAPSTTAQTPSPTAIPSAPLPVSASTSDASTSFFSNKWVKEILWVALFIAIAMAWPSIADFLAPPNARYAAQIKTAIDADLITKNYAVTCTDVTLVRESSSKFTGFAKFSDGGTGDVDYLVDASGQAIYHYNYPAAWIWNSPKPNP